MFCFNPCCIGLVVTTRRVGHSGYSSSTWFQSLLYWISRYDIISAVDKAVNEMFQSLLYWISRYDVPASEAAHAVDACFNPCCIGLVVTTTWVCPQFLRWFLFQSLLYWISRYDNITGRSSNVKPIGFNPCCIGLVVTTRISVSYDVGGPVFQSLLYWISRYDLETADL